MEINSLEQKLVNCLECLRKGELVSFPTDTGWVLACDASNDHSVKQLKDMDPESLITVLLADERDLLKHVSGLDLDVFNFLDQQQVPVAIYFDGLLGISDHILNKEHSAPFRIVKEDFSRHLLKRFKKPVAAMSIRSMLNPGSFYQVKGLSWNDEFLEQQLVHWSSGNVTILHL